MTKEIHRLERMFKARTVAIVGASENGIRSRNAIQAMSTTGVDLHLVNWRGGTVEGRPTVRSLTELCEQGVVPDVALLFVANKTAVQVTAEARQLGIGGVIVNAGGFAEAGPEGEELQHQLVLAAGDMPVIGPNCNGIIAPGLGLHLAGSPAGRAISKGKIAFVTHSGATMMPMANAAVERRIGHSYLVSTGNEAAIDMADVVDYLVTDPDTSAICLLIETVRNPSAFWSAIDKAIAAGKPVLALKNGRSTRGQAIAKSHTGAIAGDAWAYESALRQHGVILAHDLADLADKSVLFDHLTQRQWSAVDGLVVLSGSGGWATMASDVCAEEGVNLPDLQQLQPAISEIVLGVSVVNPLDLTGQSMTDPAVNAAAISVFAECDEVDTILLQSPVGQQSARSVHNLASSVIELAPRSDKVFIVGSIEGGAIGDVMQEYIDSGVAVCRGIRPTARALRAMGDFVAYRRIAKDSNADFVVLPKPSGIVSHRQAGRMLSFGAAMEFLRARGIPVAPYHLVGADDSIPSNVPFKPPFVVKLADVPHRSDIGAVKVGIQLSELGNVIQELRELARTQNESPLVVIQQQFNITSELLLGINEQNELGPLVVCGLGGIFVEVLKKASGRIAPFGEEQAETMINEINVNGVLDGPRSTMPWPKTELARLLTNMGAIAAGAHEWLESMDINPLALTPEGIVALDALIIVRP